LRAILLKNKGKHKMQVF